MELCSDGHDEVCFDVRNCPVCDKLKEISDLEDKIYDLQQDNDSLRNEVDMMGEEITELKLENDNG